MQVEPVSDTNSGFLAQYDSLSLDQCREPRGHYPKGRIRFKTTSHHQVDSEPGKALLKPGPSEAFAQNSGNCCPPE